MPKRPGCVVVRSQSRRKPRVDRSAPVRLRVTATLGPIDTRSCLIHLHVLPRRHNLRRTRCRRGMWCTLVQLVLGIYSSVGILRFFEYDRDKVSPSPCAVKLHCFTTGTQRQNKEIAQGVGYQMSPSSFKPLIFTQSTCRIPSVRSRFCTADDPHRLRPDRSTPILYPRTEPLESSSGSPFQERYRMG